MEYDGMYVRLFACRRRCKHGFPTISTISTAVSCTGASPVASFLGKIPSWMLGHGWFMGNNGCYTFIMLSLINRMIFTRFGHRTLKSTLAHLGWKVMEIYEREPKIICTRVTRSSYMTRATSNTRKNMEEQSQTGSDFFNWADERLVLRISIP